MEKSKTGRKEEEEEANGPATSTNIASVVHLTLFASGPGKLGAKFITPELAQTITCWKENPRLHAVQET